ncbi:MAG: NgoMIV family type II restriction endonuclease [Streptosporangiaceae bacterium]
MREILQPVISGGRLTAPFATALLGWKPSSKNKLAWPLVPNFADVDNAESMRIAAGVLDALGVRRDVMSDVPKDPGGPLEQAVCDHLGSAVATRHPDRSWLVSRGLVITGFDQYAHLSEVHALVRANPELRITIGMDYLIKPDVTVGLDGVPTASGLPPLHAAISCKWTIRSDRVQNIRHECLQMIRHRRGRQPHLVTVTAEPLPSRLASIARGTGEVDAVYHIAYDAMAASVAANANLDQAEAWREVTGQRRVLSYEMLVDTLAAW